MVKVSVSLLRKRAEHNEGILSDLEEVALHQQDITDLGQLPVWCPRLKILLLQGNLINDLGKIGRLRDLTYLNLALNNIEDLSLGSLADCEALTKLDLTANFILDLSGAADVMQNLTSLNELYMNGNPCCSYPGYRSYLINRLVHLRELDGEPIRHLQRVGAWKNSLDVETGVNKAQMEAKKKREYKKKTLNENSERITESNLEESDKDLEERWQVESSDHSPETRLSMHEEMKKRREKNEGIEAQKKIKEIKLFTKEGRPLNVNEAKIDFKFTENEANNNFILEVYTYKHLDPSLLLCDIQPSLVKVTIKGKIFQLVLPEEVQSSSSTAQRSQVTGHLVITMPKVAVSSYLPYIQKYKIQKEDNLIGTEKENKSSADGDHDHKLYNTENVKDDTDFNIDDVPPLE